MQTSPSWRTSSVLRLVPVLWGLALVTVAPLLAQRTTFTAADYARAERLLAQNLNGLVVGGAVAPNWLANDRFWYRTTTLTGSQFLLVDPARRTKAPAFDHARLAAALSTAAGQQYRGEQLPFTQIELTEDGSTVSFAVGNRRWSCD